jgi:hypothetical protein
MKTIHGVGIMKDPTVDGAKEMNKIPGLEGQVWVEAIEGNTPDISKYTQFDWYQYVW